MIGTMNALITTLNQTYLQQQNVDHEPRQDQRKWHEEVIKHAEVLEGEDFSVWHFKMRNLISTYVGEGLLNKMDISAAHAIEVTPDQYPEGQVQEFEVMARKLFSVLVIKTAGAAHTVVKNVTSMNGFEAWRRLCQRYNPHTTGKMMTLIRKAINPTKVKSLKEVEKSIDSWEELMKTLDRDYHEELSESLKMGILLEMVPSQITESLMNVLPDPKKESNAYTKTKELILQTVIHKTDFLKATPMDVGAFNYNDKHEEAEEPEQWAEDLNNFYPKGNGKGNGKGKGKGPTCWNCGEPGHRRAECPYPQGTQEAAGKGWPQDSWTKGHWSKGNRDKGGKGWNSKGGFGKGQSGKWGAPGGYVPGKGWNPKGKGGKGDGRAGVQTYGLDDVAQVSDDWSLAICHLDRRPEVLNVAGNKHDHQMKQPTLTANLADFIKSKDSKRSPQTKPAVAMSNRFSALEDEDEMKEITLEDGTLVQEIQPDMNKNISPPPAQVFQRPARRRPNLRKSAHQTGCGCCAKNAEDADQDEDLILGAFCGESDAKNEEDDNQDEDLILGAFFDKHEPIHSLSEPKWVDIEVVMDSGAAESVAPSAVAPWVRIKESVGSREGREYLSASGDVLRNLGEKELNVITCEGFPATTTFQIADVTRPLCSIAKVCDKGNKVIFEKDCGYVEDQWGTRSYFQRKGNIYTMNFYALDTGNQGSAHQPEGFQRQSK